MGMDECRDGGGALQGGEKGCVSGVTGGDAGVSKNALITGAQDGGSGEPGEEGFAVEGEKAFKLVSVPCLPFRS